MVGELQQNLFPATAGTVRCLLSRPSVFLALIR
jgi:hypothetical protein